MKYTYAYKTSDGIRHEAAMEAPSREVVFAELRKQGVKAIKVVATDGSKANGEMHGVRKRVVALGTICLVLGAVLAVLIAFRAGEKSNNPTIQQSSNSFLTDQTRRQVIGDAAIIEKGIRTGWVDVFEHEGDRFLASFAIPGVKAGVGTTSVAALEECLSEKVEKRGGGGQRNLSSSSNPQSATRNPQPATRNSQRSLEAQQIIAMVDGMKREARAYLAAGGTVVEYGKRLTERQDAEIAVYKHAEAEVLAAQKSMPEADFTKFYEQRNDELRNLGIRPITLPE